MRTDFWTKDRIVTLKRLWGQGKTASTIGKELGGISRAAVLGKIFRLRLGTAGKPAKPPSQKAKARKQKAQSVPPNDGPTRRRGAEPQQVAAPRVSKRKSLFELTSRCCRWPHGEPGTKNFFFCGAPGADLENGLPYCPQHMRRAYIVPPEHAGTSGLPTSRTTSLTTSLTPWRVVSRAA
jgi:GcrA cell cycle regulator